MNSEALILTHFVKDAGFGPYLYVLTWRLPSGPKRYYMVFSRLSELNAHIARLQKTQVQDIHWELAADHLSFKTPGLSGV